MQDIMGSVRRSLVFRSTSGDDTGGFGGLVDKIGSSIRRSRIGLFSKPLVPALPTLRNVEVPPIRWRKGELIGCGAFGRVYMGMNLDSGELIAVKQVLIAANSASKEKTQAHIQELEEEVKLLKNLSHPNIVRYLGTARENDSLNILLEFVPGGSISSLLGKFGSFPEAVIIMYTKQLLLGLEYLHKNGIMHRDIKGANILVDNKGCIKLADFGASKKVVELATLNGAKSMKGTPYWMAPEVILQTGHSFSADIWSVGCTVIEMATGKPPWSQQYQEVAALFHIGTTKAHPPIPEHLSSEAIDFLLKCLQKEPELRASASDLLRHPFVTGQNQQPHSVFCNSVKESENLITTTSMNLKNSMNSIIRSTSIGLKDVCEMGSVRCSKVYPHKVSGTGSYWGQRSFDDHDMCQIDDKDLMLTALPKFNSALKSVDLDKSFNPMCEPTDEWRCKFDESPEEMRSETNLSCSLTTHGNTDDLPISSKKGNENNFTFPCGPLAADEEEEVTELKIIAFLDEKALDLKKLQTPLYKEFYDTLNAVGSPNTLEKKNNENITNFSNLPPKSKSPKRFPSRRFSSIVDAASKLKPGSHTDCALNSSGFHDRVLYEVQSSQLSELSPSDSFNERQRKWKEELDQELERKREIMRQAGLGLGGKTSSPKERIPTRHRDRGGDT